MKKMSNFFKNIAKVIDRRVVVPITKIILKITSKFDKSGRKFENWISKTNTLLFLSLFLLANLIIEYTI